MHAFPHRLDKTKTNLKPDHCNNSTPYNKPGSVAVGKTNSPGIDGKRDLNGEVEYLTLAADSVGFQHKLAETGKQVGGNEGGIRKRGCGTKQSLCIGVCIRLYECMLNIEIKARSYPICKMHKYLT